MTPLNVFFLLLTFPIALYCLTCNQDSGQSNSYTECTASNNCYTITEHDQNGSVEKTVQGCDNNQCTGNSDFDNPRRSDGSYSHIHCCTTDYCNSSVSTTMLTIPLLLTVFYYLRK